MKARMKIALIGCGAMGRLIEKLATKQGDEIGVTVSSGDATRTSSDLANAVRDHDVAIDFSIAAAVPRNVSACVLAGVPLVEGTTGWHSQLDEVESMVNDGNGTLIYGSNFSIGVQIFYLLAARAAELFRGVEAYDPFLEEAHHKRKRDAPSGTALQIQGLVQSTLERAVPTTSTRAGYIPGTHRLGFDSDADQILLIHEARNREGFALGALLAAKWIKGRKGVFEFSEAFASVIGTQKP